MVYAAGLGSRFSTILLKYLVQWVRTGRILKRERPNAIFVMTPPLVAALPAFWYGLRHKSRIVLDAHTAAFMHPRWRRLQWLQLALCRRAATTLVSNAHLADIVHAGGGHATIIPDVPVIFSEVHSFPRSREFTVAVICSFNYDEPIGAIFQAAGLVSDVRFYVTGDPRHLPQETRASIPPNVELTGFLSTPVYGGLLQASDVVLTLTTRDHTMLRGAYEAIYQGTPVIISDWPLLRAAFSQGAIHVDNSVEGIVKAIDAMRQTIEDYRREALQLREHKLKAWGVAKQAILTAIHDGNR